MEPLNKLTADGACRTVFSNDVSFASFYNAAIFEGKQIIHPERLVRYENDISFLINDSKRAEDKKEEGILLLKVIINGNLLFTRDKSIKVVLMKRWLFVVESMKCWNI